MTPPDRVVRLDGRPVAEAVFDGDDPLVRAGDGLVETMRAHRGVVAWADAHLGRLARSAEVLAIPAPPPETLAREVDAALAAAAGDDHRVRLCVTGAGRVWVEVAPLAPPAPVPRALRAVTLRGAWAPGAWIAEHKTTSRALWAWAGRRAAAAGADDALLLDADARMGESVTANVVVVDAGGSRLTAPARGLLPGVGRAWLLGETAVTERAATAREWRRAREVLLVGALRGVDAVVEIDGAPVGEAVPGPVARDLAARWHAAVTRTP
jgi:branched-subunit amino acid aminotransferase/4-amino-4-deoxychorismate lyase